MFQSHRVTRRSSTTRLVLVQVMDRANDSGVNGRALQALNDLGTGRRVSNEVLDGGSRMRQT